MLRIVFMGTPDFSVPTISEIIAAGHDIAAAYCQPPRRAGRGMAQRKSPVHAFADDAGIPVYTPRSLKTADEQAIFAGHAADAAVVVAYGLILPKPILDAPRFGCLNLHASSLPRWRGAAPIQRAIMAGDTQTAAMVMQMDEGLDTGPICLAERVPIGLDATAGELHDELALRGADLMVRALAALERGSLVATPQSETGVTYASKIEKAETHIDFSRPSAEVHNHIRGLSPFPGAWFEVTLGGKTERIKALRSQLVAESGGPAGEVLTSDLVTGCGTGAIRLVELQRSGKKPMPASEFMRGFELPEGTRLT